MIYHHYKMAVEVYISGIKKLIRGFMTLVDFETMRAKKAALSLKEDLLTWDLSKGVSR